MTPKKSYNVIMPKLGMTMTQATIVEWYAEDGDEVSKGDVLFTLETEKSTLDIEAPASGILHIRVPALETAPVKTVIAVIESASDSESKASAEAGAATGADETAPSLSDTDAPIRASPKARALAREENISLASLADIEGSGPRDMIVEADVKAALASRAEVQATPVARRLAEHLEVDLSQVSGSGPRGRVIKADVERAASPEASPEEKPPSAPQPALPLEGLRGIIAERLSASWRARPHVTVMREIDATAMVALREQITAERPDHGKLSYNALIVRAATLALREHPHINVQLTEDGIVQMPDINIGLAVDTERGLLVPVLHQADAKPLLELDAALKALAQRALEGRCLPDELTGGAFTVTNLGMYGVEAFTPIINPPESAILGVGSIIAKPAVHQGEIAIRQMMTLSLVFDHRVIDGAPAARFLQRITHLLEHPVTLVL